MNPYDVLGIQITATQEEIKAAYKKLSAQYHPDRNQDAGASEMMKNINVAYDLLSDPKKRKRYDETGDMSAASTFDRDVQDIVVSMFICYITANDTLDYDMKAAMKSSLAKVLNEAKGKCIETQITLKHYEKAKKKLKAKNNIFVIALDKNIAGMQEEIQRLQNRQKILVAAIQLVEDEFDWDNGMPEFKTVYRISGGPSNYYSTD